MNSNEHKVTLANGTEVYWDKFCTWSPQKQYMSLTPPRLGKKCSAEEIENRSKAQVKRFANNPVSGATRQKISESNLHRKRTDEQKGKMKLGWEKLKASGWIHKNKGKSNPSLWKAIMTPNGVFPSNLALAERIYTDLGLSSVAYAKSKISYWLKKYPDDYYYVNR